MQCPQCNALLEFFDDKVSTRPVGVKCGTCGLKLFSHALSMYIKAQYTKAVTYLMSVSNIPEDAFIACKSCAGHGWVPATPEQISNTCRDCDGLGWVKYRSS